MHACLGIIHPNPLQLLLPVCLSLSLLRLIYLPFPSLSPQALGPFPEMLTRRNPVPRTLERPAQGRVNRVWRRPGSLVAGWVLLRKDAVLLRGKLGTSIEAGIFIGRHNAMLKYHVWHHVIAGHAPAARLCWSGWGNKLASDRPSPSSPSAMQPGALPLFQVGSSVAMVQVTVARMARLRCLWRGFQRSGTGQHASSTMTAVPMSQPPGDCDQGPASHPRPSASGFIVSCLSRQMALAQMG